MRLSPRIKTVIPASLNSSHAQMDAMILNLSMDGIFFKGHLPGSHVGDTIFVKYRLPVYGDFEHNGVAAWRDNSGTAITFYNLDISAKIKLWGYISPHLSDLDACPYCGEKYDIKPSECRVCGWGLLFDSLSYFEYYEKMHLQKKNLFGNRTSCS